MIGADLSCRSAAALVTDLVEDALPPEERLDLELHMVVCEGCDAMVRQMRATIHVLGVLPRDRVPEEDLVGAILDRIGSGGDAAG